MKSTYSKNEDILLYVKIENTGDVAGAEVVQVYSHDVKAFVMRPEKELKSFQKVQLQPGEIKTVKLKIPVSSLAFYDEGINDWNLEAGDFKLMVGTSSRKIKKVVEITVNN